MVVDFANRLLLAHPLYYSAEVLKGKQGINKVAEEG